MPTPFSKPLQLTVATLALMVIVVFLLLGGLTFASERRVRRAIDSSVQLDVYGRACRLIEEAAVSPASRSDRVDAAVRALESTSRAAQAKDPDAARLFRSARDRLRAGSAWTDDSLQRSLSDCTAAIDVAQSSHVHRMKEMRNRLDEELTIALIAPVLILGLLAAVVHYARSRLFEPLRALGVLVSRLSEGQLKPAAVGQADATVRPLYENYNHLVNRLRELEAKNREHAESLTREVQAATRALMAQQRSLAHAERLAAAGEVAACVAHELRNPIASIQVTLSNLQTEVEEQDVRERLGLVANEVTRLGRTLEGLLAQSRHTPEPARPLRLDQTIRQLIVLTSYQLPPGVRLASRVPDGLEALLPEDRLRQALLNLVLNAAEAMGEASGTILVEAESAGEHLRISVTDEGPGFPEEQLRGASQPFLTTRPGGTGLGLAIVRRFTRDAAGKLQLENLEPRGARATMVLPLRGIDA